MLLKLIVYTSMNKLWAYFRVICALIWSWSDAIYPDRHPVSISEKTSYRQISWSLEAARFVFRIVWSLWNLTGTSAALLPMCLSNFKAIQQFKVPISWLRNFTRSDDKTSFRILRRGPGCRTFQLGLHLVTISAMPPIDYYITIFLLKNCDRS